MLESRRILAPVLVIGLFAACAKTSPSSGDTSAAAVAAAAPDTKADEAAIIRLDSAWMRQVMAKNVDSLMTYYDSGAVSYGFGAPAMGTDQVRAGYAEYVKSTVADPILKTNGVKFSDDGAMAFDHGTYSMTVTAPGGKPEKVNGAFLNVWRKLDGQWKLVAEMSTPMAPPKA
ncbi:MAG: nuclear transport factor 2 family protein [Gemmatimonadales bacterium]